LANTSTSVVIPKGTLRPNTLYFASLAFVKQAGTDHSINGIPATSGNSKVTAFQIFTGTQVTPPRQPVLIEAGFNPNGSFHLTVQADPGQTCLIQSQQDLSGTWSTRATLSSPDGVLNFDDNQAGPAPFRFYRAVTAP